MTNKLTTYLTGIIVLLAALISLIALSPKVSAAVDNDPDCDNVAIIRCGAFTADKMREKAAQGDVPKVFNAFGISQNDLKGKYVNGIVWRDGRVTVDGKTVATGAMTAGRNFGGTPIAGTNAGKYPTSKFVTEGQTAFVRMVDGKFKFAIIKPCGNPVTATPTTTPQTEPVPEDIKVCDLRTYEIITIKETQFDKDKYTKNLDLCEKLKVCELSTFKVITIKEGEFDKTKHSRDLSDCEKTSTPDMIEVCELATKEIIEIEVSEFDNTKHSKDLDVCAEEEVVVEEEKDEETPQVLAETGPGAALTGLFGTGALGYGAYTYLQSRRHLLDKLLKR